MEAGILTGLPIGSVNYGKDGAGAEKAAQQINQVVVIVVTAVRMLFPGRSASVLFSLFL